MQEGADAFTLKLDHPTRGSAIVEVAKGKASHGGRIGFASSGAPAPLPLGETVESIDVTDAGPRWQ